MSSLPRISGSVQASRPSLTLFAPIGPIIADDTEPYIPTKAEEAEWAGYTLALDGERAKPVSGPGWSAEACWAWLRGSNEGRKARDLAEAYELGRAPGLETEISEPPAGFTREEQAEYRRGFAAGQDEAADDREFEAWVDSEDRERAELAFAEPIGGGLTCERYWEPAECRELATGHIAAILDRASPFPMPDPEEGGDS